MYVERSELLGKSAFFHVGLNLSRAEELSKQPIHIRPDGSTYFESYFPNHSHDDPDFENRTYGDDNEPNMSYMMCLNQGDWAWFIESVIVTNRGDWGYHIVYGFDIEAHYYQKKGTGHWEPAVSKNHIRRMKNCPHYPVWNKDDCVVILGKDTSKNLFKKPLRISVGVDPYPWLKEAMGIPADRRLTASTAPRWWQWKDATLHRRDTLTEAILGRVDYPSR